MNLSPAELAALRHMAKGYGFKHEGSIWKSTGGELTLISNSTMQRLARRGLVTFVGVVPGTNPAITSNGREAIA